MNWAEPSIRAEQALARANKCATNGDLPTAMLECDAAVTYINEMFDALEQEWNLRENPQG
jgi:hypothetical protein